MTTASVVVGLEFTQLPRQIDRIPEERAVKILGKRPGNTVLTRSVSVAWSEAAGCLSRR